MPPDPPSGSRLRLFEQILDGLNYGFIIENMQNMRLNHWSFKRLVRVSGFSKGLRERRFSLLFSPFSSRNDTQAVNRPLLGLYQLPKTLASKTRPSAETVLIIKMIFLMIM